MLTTAIRPQEADYAESFEKYVRLVREGCILSTLNRQMESTLALLAKISDQQADIRPMPDKWSIKEVLGHVIDAERVFSYRALRFARNDPTELHRFDPGDYIRQANFNQQHLSDLVEAFELVRRATTHFFKNLDHEAWERSGVANGKKVTVRALAYIIAGHETHHITRALNLNN